MEIEELIAIVYNPTKDDGLKDDDCKFLKFLLTKCNFNSPCFVLSGHGGDFKAGIYFPHIIKFHVRNYKVYIPKTCGSALCYTILQAEELLIGKNTKITQIDPTFEHNGEYVRAIKYIRSSDEELRVKAREIFDLAQEKIIELCKPPSIFEFKTLDPDEFQTKELITANFMNKEEHEKAITQKELEELEINYKKIDDEDVLNLAHEFIEACQDFTIDNEVRVIFVSSKQIVLADGGIGRFLCPLH